MQLCNKCGKLFLNDGILHQCDGNQDRKILWLDVETGGLNPKIHSLLQLSGVVYKSGEILDKFDAYHKSKVYHVTQTALSINGIDLRKVEGLSSEELVKQFKAFINKNFGVDGIIYIAGRNPGFDMSFLTELLLGNNEYDLLRRFSHRYTDMSSIVWFLIDMGLLPPDINNTSGVYEYFGIHEEQFHSSIDCCMNTIKVYEALTGVIKAISAADRSNEQPVTSSSNNEHTEIETGNPE